MAFHKDDLVFVVRGREKRRIDTVEVFMAEAPLVRGTFPSKKSDVGQNELVNFIFQVCTALEPSEYRRIAVNYADQDHTAWLSGSFVTKMKQREISPEHYYLHIE